MARCVNELKRIYGIKHGNNQNSMSNNFTSKTLAESIGLTRQQINNFEKLNKLIPEFQEMVEDGNLSTLKHYGMSALHLIATLPSEELDGKLQTSTNSCLMSSNKGVRKLLIDE
ncbi:hypothetical protein BTR23_07365 [Alkalihalophilus pseudofirmus]|nr:hypothetical protein BTR23_07365 [Alkalihalophilus pseudofirmus]